MKLWYSLDFCFKKRLLKKVLIVHTDQARFTSKNTQKQREHSHFHLLPVKTLYIDVTWAQNIILTSVGIHTKPRGLCSFHVHQWLFFFWTLQAEAALCKGARGLVRAFNTHSSAVILSKLYMKGCDTLKTARMQEEPWAGTLHTFSPLLSLCRNPIWINVTQRVWLRLWGIRREAWNTYRQTSRRHISPWRWLDPPPSAPAHPRSAVHSCT